MGWVRIDDAFYDHAKHMAAGPLASHLFVVALAWSNRNLTDGRIPRGQVGRLVAWDGISDNGHGRSHGGSHKGVTGLILAERLVDVGLLERADGDYLIHDYLDFQPSRADVMAERQAATERKRRSREKSRRSSHNGSREESLRDVGRGHGHVTPPPNPNPKGTDRSSDLSASDVDDRVEFHDLALLLADLIQRNGSKRPTDAQIRSWRKPVRLMVERDGRPLEQIERAIRWCQADDFWKANVLSMGKLREKFDQLRLAAERQRNGAAPRNVRALQAIRGGVA